MKAPETIIITGVAGFIGSNLAQRLLSQGHMVIGIDDLSHGFERNMAALRSNPHFTFLKGDIGDKNILNAHKAEVLVHLASQKIPRYTNALKTLEQNYELLKNVVQKCVKDKAKIVFASTSDVYGKNKQLPLHEDSELVLGSTKIKRWAYALSKIYGEQFIIANSDEYGLDYTIVRFFGSYGINQNLSWWGGPQSVFIEKALKKEPIEIHGDGLQTRTFTYIDDTISGLMDCIFEERASEEIFNIGSNTTEEISILDLAKLIWSLVNGKDSKILLNFIPYEQFGRYEDVNRRVPDIEKIKSFFGYSPKVSLEEGLRKTIEWQKTVMGK